MASVSAASNAARLRLEGKVALITGAASGIGKICATGFAKHGAKVAIADIEDDKAQKLCEELGSTSTFLHYDVTKESDVEKAVNTTASKYGKLDIMFNNAGIVGEAKPSILDNDLSEFKKIIDVNLVGAFLGIKHAARVMAPDRRGTIINTASVCSVIGGVASHAYTSSKHAVLGLTKNAAVELGRHGIRVNCVSPYVVATPLSMEFFNLSKERCHAVYSNLKGTTLDPEDVAEAALYLASDESMLVGIILLLMVASLFSILSSVFLNKLIKGGWVLSVWFRVFGYVN